MRLLRFKLGLCLVWLAQKAMPADITVYAKQDIESRWADTASLTDADIASMIREFRRFDSIERTGLR